MQSCLVIRTRKLTLLLVRSAQAHLPTADHLRHQHNPAHLSPFPLPLPPHQLHPSPVHKMAAAAPNSSDILGSASFASPASRDYTEAPTAASILSGGIDPSALHPLAGLVDNKDLDYLLLDDDKINGLDGGKTALPTRGWGDELCYGTGSTYLAGQSHNPPRQCRLSANES